MRNRRISGIRGRIGPPCPLATALALLLAVGASPACRGLDIEEPPGRVASSWRDRKLFVTHRFDVLATKRGAVADAHGRVDAAAERFEAATGRAVPRGLVLAMDAGDAPLKGSSTEAWMEAMAGWHAEVTGSPAPRSSRPRLRPDSEDVFETEEEAFEFAARLIAAAVPLDTASLALPESIRERAAWAAIVPTWRNSNRSVDHMLDVAKSRVPWHRRVLLATMMPFLRSRLEEELSRGVREPLFRAWVATLADSDEQADAWIARLAEAERMSTSEAPDPDVEELGADARRAEPDALEASSESGVGPGSR